MSELTAFALSEVNLKLHGWMAIIFKRGQKNSRFSFGVGILGALLFVCWTHVNGLVGYRECVSCLASTFGYLVTFCMFINSFFSSYFFLLLLWGFSIFYVHRSEETKKKNVKVEENSRCKVTRQSSAATSLVNAEKFVKLFHSLLYEEETLGTELESIEKKVSKLTIATKELRRIQIIIDSLKTQVFHNFHSPMNDSKRVLDVIDKFEHTKVYVDLRRHLLDKAHCQLSKFTVNGMALKIWLSEALEFQEKLHHTTCSSNSDFQQHFSLLLGIRKDSEVVRKKLLEYEHSAQSLTATLQEMSACSGIFHKAFEERSSQNEKRKWHDILTVSIKEEETQVAQRFSTVTKLNECYQAHLNGLYQKTLQ
ncbi:uncharacterized protein RB166_010903 [Leptodactylus fuscus]|uniref:uncharacterized protein LOC142209115 n=1 Tax=Leptodactylus fuscus TaxID=238119 RepID=UPI003F4E5929